MKRSISFVLAAVMLVPVLGCKQQAATPGAVAPTFYSQAATAMNGFSATLAQAQSLFGTAYQEQMLDQQTFNKGQQVFLQVASSGDLIVSGLQASAPQAQILAQINALIAQIGTMPQAFAIKNPQSQAAFVSLTNALVNILKATEANLPQPATAKP